jgi:hypothetical protein
MSSTAKTAMAAAALRPAAPETIVVVGWISKLCCGEEGRFVARAR